MRLIRCSEYYKTPTNRRSIATMKNKKQSIALAREIVYRSLFFSSDSCNYFYDRVSVKQWHLFLEVNFFLSKKGLENIDRLELSRVLYKMKKDGVILQTFLAVPIENNRWIFNLSRHKKDMGLD